MFGLRLDGVLVVVDAEQIRAQALNKYVGDTVLRQLAQADLILLNKIDVAPDLPGVRSWLASHNAPEVPAFEAVRRDVPLRSSSAAAPPTQRDRRRQGFGK